VQNRRPALARLRAEKRFTILGGSTAPWVTDPLWNLNWSSHMQNPKTHLSTKTGHPQFRIVSRLSAANFALQTQFIVQKTEGKIERQLPANITL